MDVADRALRVGQVLLTDQDERPLGHASGVDVALGGGEFGVGARQVHGAGPAAPRVGPRHTAFDGEVDLERAGAAAEPSVGTRDPARQPVAENAGDRLGRQVEHRHVGGRQLRGRLDPHARLDLAAQVAQQRGHRVGDRLRPARGDRPAVAVARGDDAQPDRRGHRVVQRPKGMRRNTSEQCPGLRGAEPPGERGGGQHGGRAEPGQRQRMVRAPAAAGP